MQSHPGTRLFPALASFSSAVKQHLVESEKGESVPLGQGGNQSELSKWLEPEPKYSTGESVISLFLSIVDRS